MEATRKHAQRTARAPTAFSSREFSGSTSTAGAAPAIRNRRHLRYAGKCVLVVMAEASRRRPPRNRYPVPARRVAASVSSRPAPAPADRFAVAAQKQLSDQRGGGPPGYHSPCPKSVSPRGCVSFCFRPVISPPFLRSFGLTPSAAVLHSARSGSSIDTNLGSRPMVSRTSRAARSVWVAGPRPSILDPLGLGVRLRHAPGFPDPLDLHGVFELDLGFLDLSTDRCSGRRLRRAGERDVTLRLQAVQMWIEADPTGARGGETSHQHADP